MTKKILAVLLALAMLLSLCSVNVFAADTEEIFSETLTATKGDYGWCVSIMNKGSETLSRFLTAAKTEGSEVTVTFPAVTKAGWLQLVWQECTHWKMATEVLSGSGSQIKGTGADVMADLAAGHTKSPDDENDIDVSPFKEDDVQLCINGDFAEVTESSMNVNVVVTVPKAEEKPEPEPEKLAKPVTLQLHLKNGATAPIVIEHYGKTVYDIDAVDGMDCFVLKNSNQYNGDFYDIDLPDGTVVNSSIMFDNTAAELEDAAATYTYNASRNFELKYYLSVGYEWADSILIKNWDNCKNAKKITLTLDVVKPDVKIPEPTDKTFVLTKKSPTDSSLSATVTLYPKKDLTLNEFLNTVEKATVNINNITATTDNGTILTASDLTAIGKEDQFSILSGTTISGTKGEETARWYPAGGTGGGTTIPTGNYSHGFQTSADYYSNLPDDTAGWGKIGFEVYLGINAEAAKATDYVVINFDSATVDVTYKPGADVELPEGYVAEKTISSTAAITIPKNDNDDNANGTLTTVTMDDFKFKESDYIVFSFVPAEGVTGQAAVQVQNTDWDSDWQGVGGGTNVTTVSFYFKDLLAKNPKVTIDNLKQVLFQAWDVKVGDVIESYTIVIARKTIPTRGEEPKTYKADTILDSAVKVATTEGAKVTVTPESSVKADGILVALKDGEPAEHAGKVTVNYKVPPVQIETHPELDTYEKISGKDLNVAISETPTNILVATNDNNTELDNAVKKSLHAEGCENYYLKITVNGTLTSISADDNGSTSVALPAEAIKVGTVTDGVTTYYVAYADLVAAWKDSFYAENHYGATGPFAKIWNIKATGTGTVTFAGVVEAPVEPEIKDPSTPVSEEDLAKVNQTENTGTNVLGSFALTNYLPEELNGTLPANDSIVVVVKGSITNNSEKEDAKVTLRAYLTPGVDSSKSNIAIISQTFGKFETAFELTANAADAKEIQFKRGYTWQEPLDEGLSATFTFDSIGIFHGTLDEYNAATTAATYLPATIAATNVASEGPEVVEFAEGDYYVEVATNSEKEIESIVIEYTDAAATTAPALDYIKVLDPNADPNPPTPPTPPVYVPGGGVILDLGPEFHGLLQGGKLIPMAHIYNDFGVCTICGRIQPAEAETEGDEVVVDTPVEDTDNNAEEEGDDLTVTDPEPTTPTEKNPETGIALAVVPMLVAAAAVMATRKH